MDTSKNFYVGVEDSKSFRRNLLEASRSVVSILKANHKIKNIRIQKQKYTELLKQHVKEINQLVINMDSAMPDVGIRASKKRREQKEEVISTKKESYDGSELDMLENQIKEIDSKLNNLQ